MKKIRHWAFIAVLVIPLMGQSQAPFKTGDIVVVRLGDGITPYDGQTAPMFLDEYTPAGTLVQSIALPTADNGSNLRITHGYSRGDHSFLTLSPDKKFLSIVGFTANPGLNTNSIDNTTNRTIARIDFNGAINTSTSISGAEGSFGWPTSAVTDDGSRFWVIHESGLGGIRYLSLGQSTSTELYADAFLSTLSINNGQLYATYGSMPSAVGLGLPTTGGQTVTPLPGFEQGFGTTAQAFYADLNPSIPGVDVIYLAENSDYALSKFSYDPGTSSWVSNGTVGTSANNYRGLAGVVNGTSVTLYATRDILDNSASNAGTLVTLTDNSGYNGAFTGTPTVLKTASANTTFRGVAMAPQPPSVSVSVKAYLQGAYSTGLGRHKDVTAAWTAVLNAGALNQPFNVAPFNYAGTESVVSFPVATGATTDIVDWVLLELHDATTPSTIVARKACFIREDGQVVDLDGVSNPSFTGVGANNYYIVLKHRNHLTIRSSSTVFVSGAAPISYDFTTTQSKAYQNPAIVTNPAMKDLTGGGTVFGMWGGNANSNNAVRASGAIGNNDYLYLVNILLGGNTATILNTYSSGDLNLDGQVRASGSLTNNDYLILVNTILGGNTANIYTEHQ
jgi:hypothetical protein